jgi:hypothetical protein
VTGKAETVGRTSIERVRDICRRLPECAVDGDQHHKLAVRGRTLAERID